MSTEQPFQMGRRDVLKGAMAASLSLAAGAWGTRPAPGQAADQPSPDAIRR